MYSVSVNFPTICPTTSIRHHQIPLISTEGGKDRDHLLRFLRKQGTVFSTTYKKVPLKGKVSCIELPFPGESTLVPLLSRRGIDPHLLNPDTDPQLHTCNEVTESKPRAQQDPPDV